MTASIDLDSLLDPEELRRNGECPWTFFAYPSSMEDTHGLPPDADALKLLKALEARGIPAGIWSHGEGEQTTYLFTRYADRFRLHEAIAQFATQHGLSPDVLTLRAERLFSNSDANS